MKVTRKIQSYKRRFIELMADKDTEMRMFSALQDQIEKSGNNYVVKGYSISKNGFTIDLRIED